MASRRYAQPPPLNFPQARKALLFPPIRRFKIRYPRAATPAHAEFKIANPPSANA